jgi:hypothetical protein
MPWAAFLFLNLLGGFLALQAMPLIHIYQQPAMAYLLLLAGAALMTVATVAVIRPLYFPAYSRFGKAAQRLILAGATLAAFVLTICVAHAIVDSGLLCDCLTRLSFADAWQAEPTHLVALLTLLTLIYMLSLWSFTEIIKQRMRRAEA